MAWEKSGDKIIEYSYYALFFLVPLVMTPWNFELFEFNKMMLTYVLTIIITASWLTKMVLAKKFLLKRTFFDIPLLIFLISQFLSFLFSIDRHTSLFGYYSRFHGGLLSTISYLLLFYAFVSNFDKRKALSAIRYLLISGVLVSAYGVLEHFGIDARYWVQDVQNRIFSTLGQPNWLAAWLIALMPIGWAFGLNLKLKTQNLKLYFYYLLSAFFYITLLYTKSRSGLLALAPTYLIFWGLVFWISRKEYKAILKHFLLLSFLFALVTLLAGSWFWGPPVRQILQKAYKPAPALASTFAQASSDRQTSVEQPTPTPIIPEVVQGGTESQTIRNIVWKGAIDVWKNYPLFGSGVETFAYSYYNFRPVEHNLVSEWDFLYNKAHNEYLNFLATTGAIGLGSYLLLIGWFLAWSLKKIKKHKIRKEPVAYRLLLIALLSGYISILITNFFGFSVVPVALQFFLYPAVAFKLVEKEKEERQEKKGVAFKYGQNIAIGLILFACCYLLFTISRMWYADFLYAKGIKLRKQGLGQQALETLEHAVSLNPNEPVIRTEDSYSAALIATAAHQEKQDEMAEKMIELALAQSTRALEISPRNVNLWKDKVKIYYLFSEINPEYLDQARQALLQAIELAPTDAKLWYNLGVLYTKLDQEKEAIETLEKTVEMKENYQSARYALGLLYQQAGRNKEAIEQTEYILTYINSSVPEVRELYRKLTGREFGVK